ncbi:hypothetical protein [Cellulomonas massiliensis]|uniref:hypothetical protein n=1 Tax=Cellulomonas massiliensis TaxID=1465811 RepID=UPI0002EA3597|nr:hypothetical protein [Cellulomonas massiliensis]
MRPGPRLVAVAVVAFLLSGIATTAYAAWSASRPVASAATIRSGTFGLDAAWVGAPSYTGMWPQDPRTGVARLTHTGDGRWQYQLAVTGGSLAGLGVTLLESTGPDVADCTATVVTPGAWSATQPTGATVYVCVRTVLGAGSAPGGSAAFTLQATARNQPTT